MTQIYEFQTFVGFQDRDTGQVFSDIEFRKCCFKSSNISTTNDPKNRSIVRNVKLVNCEAYSNCSIESSIVEDVWVEKLKMHGLFQTWGAVFKHVVLKGTIGRLMLGPIILNSFITPKQKQAFDEANVGYYESVDWALDISEAEFSECDIRGIPSQLIRRDTATQVVIKREKALEDKWRQLDLSKTYWPSAIEMFLNRSELDVVLVAPKRHKKFTDYLEGLTLLRNAGVAEPD